MSGRVSFHCLYATCSMETTCNSVKVNIGNNVIKLVESPIGWGVTVTDQGLESYLTFVNGRLHTGE